MVPVALITGASAGLGAQFARQLAGRGQRLVLAARRSERLEALAAELGNARAVTADLGKPGAATELIRNIERAGESIEILINNAGFGLHGRVAELDAARQREMIDLNCGALFDLARAVLPAMIERRSGAILNVASTAAFQPGPGMAVYFATKAFVLSLTEALHEEVKGHGIRVTALCPGPTKTEFGQVAGFAGNGMFDRWSMDAETVVRTGLAGFECNKGVVIPGALNKASAVSTRLAPRVLVRKIAGALKF